MTRCRSRKIWILLFLALFVTGLRAQEQPDYFSPDALWSFALALYDEGDYPRAAGEFLRYLFLADDGLRDAEAWFRVTKCRQRSGQLEEALAGFRRLASPESGDAWAARARYEIAITSALLGRSGESLTLLDDSELPSLTPVYDPGLIYGWCLLLKHDWSGAGDVLADSASALAQQLASIAAEGQSLPRRSPALAGVLSALLPGAGKLYAGRMADALFSFGFIGSFAVLSGLGFAEEGVRSVRGWAYGSIALLFHAGNVYGAVVAARQFNRDGEMALEARARDFYEKNLR
jgi:tetratricopeptide (TPR) repeat protein